MHYLRLISSMFAVGIIIWLASQSAAADDTESAPDNSKRNTRDSDASRVTADEQAGDVDAISTTRKIRAAIIADKGLSTYAHNVKIITIGNEVVLRGPVQSAEEKRRVESIASASSSGVRVRSELEILKR